MGDPPSLGAEYIIRIAVPEVVVASDMGADKGVDGGEAIVTLIEEELTDKPAKL